MADLKEILSPILILSAGIDVVDSLPVATSLRKKVGHIQSEKATLVTALIMTGFLFLVDEILKLIGIEVNSLAVAGSFVIFFLAREMILGITLIRDDASATASIVPLAFHIIAGAGTMTSILSLRAEYHITNIIIAIIIAIIINAIIVYVILKSSSFIERLLGNSCINIIRKNFGVVLLAIAIKLFTNNIGALV